LPEIDPEMVRPTGNNNASHGRIQSFADFTDKHRRLFQIELRIGSNMTMHSAPFAGMDASIHPSFFSSQSR
jgi:hypothetical protein